MKRDTWWIIGILVLAALIRIALWLQPLHLPANDEVEYLTVARDLLSGKGWSFYERYHWLRAPLYPLWLAGSLWLAGGNVWLAALPNIALSVLNVYLAYRLSQAIGDTLNPVVHRLTAFITAILLTNTTFAALYMSETLFTTLFSAALWLLLAWRQRGARWPDRRIFVAGGFVGSRPPDPLNATLLHTRRRRMDWGGRCRALAYSAASPGHHPDRGCLCHHRPCRSRAVDNSQLPQLP